MLNARLQKWKLLERKLTHLGFFNIWFIYLRFCLFLERGREGEREEQKRQCVVASHAPPTGDLAHNAGMCPDREWNRQPFGLQADVQSTEL